MYGSVTTKSDLTILNHSSFNKINQKVCFLTHLHITVLIAGCAYVATGCHT